MGNPVVHWEWMSQDPAKASASYEGIFGGTVAGQHAFLHQCGRPRHVPQKMVAAGGNIHVEKQAVSGMGYFSLFTDPEGRMMQLRKVAPGK